MYTEEKIDKFIELRARGWSLGHISTELGVSKRTLVDWNREYAKDVEEYHGLETQLLKEKFMATREEELTDLRRFQKDIADELGNRTLKYIETEKLFQLSVDLRGEIERMVHGKGCQEDASDGSRNGPSRSTTPANNGTSSS